MTSDHDHRQVLQRAAFTMQATGKRTAAFTEVLHGHERPFTARWDWQPFEDAPRVLVYPGWLMPTDPLVQSVPGFPLLVDNFDGTTGPVDATQSAPPVPPVPAWVLAVLRSGADRLRAERLPALVRFRWWAGEGSAFIARWDWSQRQGEPDAPRVLIFDNPSGAFVCQSLPGQPYVIDAATWRIDWLPIPGHSPRPTAPATPAPAR